MFRYSEISISALISIFYFRRNAIPTKFHPNFVGISMSFSDIGISILISMLNSDIRFRNRNFDSDIGIPTSVPDFYCSKLKQFLTEICPNFSCDCSSEFRFRLSKSKFRLLSIISTSNLIESRNYFRWKPYS
jgi:hypothetical protein